jgi:hypothetical protein
VGYFPRDPAGRRYWALTEFRYASHWWDQDPSFADGDHVWGHYLIRSHGRYLIDDEGLG